MVKTIVNDIKDATKAISRINQQVILASTPEEESKISQTMTPIVASTNQKAAVGKKTLQLLKDNTEQMKGNLLSKPKPAEMRIRENTVNTITRKFVEVMKDYQASQVNYKTEIKKKVKRQVQIVKPDATAEDIDMVMKSGGGSQALFQNAILKGDAADSIRNTYQNVADKYQDVLTLEASVAELHQMFMDFALITEQQGELLDQIEHQVKSASDFIEEANTEMVEAIEIQKSIRKKQCCIVITVLVVIGIIVGIIVGMQKAKQGSGI